MRQIRRSGLATLMVTGGALALSAGYATADSHATGGTVDSGGVGSGNAVQLPVHSPVNVCGDTVDVVGLLNPAIGNRCEIGGGHTHKDKPGTPHGGYGDDSCPGKGNGKGRGNGSGSSNQGGGSHAEAVTTNSSGILSGNGIQLPVDSPVNVSGNSVDVGGLLNPVIGNSSSNGPGESVTPPKPAQPVKPGQPEPGQVVKPAAPAPGPQSSSASLAETGAGLAGIAVPAGAAMLLGGVLLYRRNRATGDQG